MVVAHPASAVRFLQRVRRHVGALWGNAWILPLVPALYAIAVTAIGDLRPEHVVFAVYALALAAIGPRSKQFLIDTSPIIAVAVGYDLVRYVRPYAVLPDRVFNCELRAIDLAITPSGSGRTFQEMIAGAHTPALDLLFAVPYTIFIYLVFVTATYLYFRDRPRMRHYLLAFAVGNYISFFAWLLIPAAPP